MVRVKLRYIVVEINPTRKQQSSEFTVKHVSIFQALADQVQKIHGDFGAAAIRAGFVVRYINEHTRIAFIRARKGPHRFVTSVIPLIKTIEGKEVFITTLYTGATLRQCYIYLKQYQQKKLDKFCSTLNTEEEKSHLKEVMLNLDSFVNAIQ
ncbi:unnamed protein product [Phyllotreta striolata]|uniref:Ribonuclease P/MRP protein subunit POP5 n=1 Tax=Phyllotreta striolata TaxID=444603 RepID=A0A9N9XQH0_PHYSR|nr:unnamed protein product [Phyllotreta striolata]